MYWGIIYTQHTCCKGYGSDNKPIVATQGLIPGHTFYDGKEFAYHKNWKH
ncbi:hypothetical protein NTGM5_680014 [Candidatus Nitrotoga sp. M5]|nr:hypothetical protein NTGM5_680014 [Candidatus Nitrotoga sp. M5]